MKIALNQRLVVGGLAAALTLVCAGLWHVATRYGLTRSALGVFDLSLLRYGLPGLLLSPIWLKSGLFPKEADRRSILLAAVTGGIPFGYLVMVGASLAPVSHMGIILSGMAPLASAGLAYIFLRERFNAHKITGVLLIALSMFIIFLENVAYLNNRTIYGDTFFIIGAIFWSIFGVCTKHSGIDPLRFSASLSGISMIAICFIWGFIGENRFSQASAYDVVIQIFLQGFVAGVLTLILFAVSIRNLGVVLTTAIGSLLPAVTAFFGLMLLDETPSNLMLLSLVITVLGVALMSGWFSSREPKVS